MITEKKLSELAKRGVELAIKAGAEQAEAYSATSRSIQVDISGQHIHNIRTVMDAGLSIRAYHQGGMGFAYTMQLDEEAVAEGATKAAKLAIAAQPDPHFVSLPSPLEFKKVEGLYDEKLEGMSVAAAAKMAESMIGKAIELTPNAALSGAVSISGPHYYTIANSLGVDTSGRSTSLSSYLMVVLKESVDNVGSGFEFDIARRLDDFELEGVAETAVEKAKKLLGAEQAKTRVCSLLLDPNAAWDLAFGLCYLAGARDIIYDRSCLAGKLNERVASDKLTLVSDGTVEGGFMSSPVDAEGVPKKRFPILEQGVLKNYLQNSYTAARMGLENNACAARASYKSPVGVAPSNIQYQLGEASFKDLLAEVKDGIYIESFPLADRITGNISAMIDYGIQIENGELTKPVKGTMIGSNLLEILPNIDAISKEARYEPGMVLPYIRIREVQLAGR